MIIVLVGKTASGKTTVANELCKHGYKRIITYTTRPMRENEVQDVDYHFISDEQFNKMVENNEFTEYKRYNTAHGVWSYGSVVTLEQELSDNCYVIILTPQGLRDLSKKISRYIAFYLNVGLKSQLERLKKRGDEEQQIIKRLINDAKDFENVLDIVDYSFCTDISLPQEVANAILNFISSLITDKLMERHFNLLLVYNSDNIAKQKLIEYFNEKRNS
jgi:guanylate kinase